MTIISQWSHQTWLDCKDSGTQNGTKTLWRECLINRKIKRNFGWREDDCCERVRTDFIAFVFWNKRCSLLLHSATHLYLESIFMDRLLGTDFLNICVAQNEADGEGGSARLRQLSAAWTKIESLAIRASGG